MMNWLKILNQNPDYKDSKDITSSIENVAKLFPEKLRAIYDADAYDKILDEIRD